jgi:hypothetical protein
MKKKTPSESKIVMMAHTCLDNQVTITSDGWASSQCRISVKYSIAFWFVWNMCKEYQSPEVYMMRKSKNRIPAFSCSVMFRPWVCPCVFNHVKSIRPDGGCVERKARKNGRKCTVESHGWFGEWKGWKKFCSSIFFSQTLLSGFKI